MASFLSCPAMGMPCESYYFYRRIRQRQLEVILGNASCC